ncbi:DUF4259 domain-containing protein [Roseobacter sp. A03A-229]
MGTWSAGNFGNDTALDFVSGLKSVSDLEATLNRLGSATGALEADDAATALAACDLLAISIGRAPSDAPDLHGLELGEAPENLLELAKSLVQRVRQSSELAELWAKEDADEWHAILDDLVIRLTPSAPYAPPPKAAQPELPDDFLGYCYICYGMVIERDGIYFEHTEDGLGTCATYPHRTCLQDKINAPGPYWTADGAPTPVTRQQLLRDMGYDV